MTDEIVFQHGTTMVRRLRLAPGEAMGWHRDPFHRVAVVLSVMSSRFCRSALKNPKFDPGQR
jgi:hypothetical protein